VVWSVDGWWVVQWWWWLIVHRSLFYRKLVLIKIGYEICQDISPFGLKFESASPPISFQLDGGANHLFHQLFCSRP
jgi:hypothetical protein